MDQTLLRMGLRACCPDEQQWTRLEPIVVYDPGMTEEAALDYFFTKYRAWTGNRIYLFLPRHTRWFSDEDTNQMCRLLVVDMRPLYTIRDSIDRSFMGGMDII